MDNIIREFWYGNVIPHRDCRPQTPEAQQLTELIVRNRQELIMNMNDQQREIFDKLDSCWTEYVTITEEAIFSYAFKLGMRMADEAFAESFGQK